MTPEQAALIEAQTRLANRQAFWEGAKALAMILLAVAALSATLRLVDRLGPDRTQWKKLPITGVRTAYPSG